MTTVDDIYKFIDEIAPFNTAMDFDNCGLLVGGKDNIVNKVLLSLDITREVVEEANNIGANLIISHHPVIFNPIKRIESKSALHLLCKSDISAICAHTNLDMAKEGVNYSLAKRIGLVNLLPLSIYKSIDLIKINIKLSEGEKEYIKDELKKSGVVEVHDEGEGEIDVLCLPTKINDVIKVIKDIHEVHLDKEDISLGLVGKLENDMNTNEFLAHLKERLSCEGLRYIDIDKKIRKVAVCSGSGGNLINAAKEAGADAFVTGEIKHHEILFAKENGILVVDAGHYKTEDVVIEPLIDLLSSRFREVTFCKSEVFNDGIKYY